MGALVAAANQQDQCAAILAVVHAVTGAVIDTQLADPSSHGAPVTEQSNLQAVDTRDDSTARQAVPKMIQPCREGLYAVGGLLLADDYEQCSLKATAIRHRFLER